MFRKPRDDDSNNTSEPLLPSVGRPPTPPTGKANIPSGINRKPQSGDLPRSARSQGQERRVLTPAKSKSKANQSILSFFKKEVSPQKALAESSKDEYDTLFFDLEADNAVKEVVDDEQALEPSQIPTPPSDHSRHWTDEAVEQAIDTARYNENNTPVKKRRVGTGPLGFLRPKATSIESADKPLIKQSLSEEEQGSFNNQNGIETLSRELVDATTGDTLTREVDGTKREADEHHEIIAALEQEGAKGSIALAMKHDSLQLQDSRSGDNDSILATVSPAAHAQTTSRTSFDHTGTEEQEIPSLKRESTSRMDDDGFEGMDDFIDDEYPEDGEEYLERRWMDEQFLQEQEMEGEPDLQACELSETAGELPDHPTTAAPTDSSCPICSLSLVGVKDEDATLHVNNCLDGNPTPLPGTVKKEAKDADTKVGKPAPSHKRFQRSAIARPGQENPFSLATTSATGSSAFSKIMSSHAEDAAWATAAAAEMASRGKAAYQRTCPFYKILPGFFICVDAFRYGAVQGCEAYFLSHFHSDHYIGLTSSWCHGPIYCSHVTANLVRRQLRVDPKWVVDLEFERTVDVPNTQGVRVTMIPANHCPGSSLFLFEKVIGKGKTPRVQRVLHCGDFRACPAHVQHPLLRPDVVDAITGKNVRQQKLDVCYLDTTYLTPKYAFPSQEEVIRACADMCISLSKERVDENDDWETTKKERAGSGMVKFVRKDSSLVKEEIEAEADIHAMKVSNRNSGKKARGKLLVICGTYSIGKERICLGIARALNCKIYAPPNKQKICAALEDAELSARLTSDPLEAQVHMQMIMEIRAETLADYLTQYKPHFSRIVGFRPSGWNYRPPNSRFTESPLVTTVLHSDNWKSKYSMAELAPQRGSTREASCFGVPYSEHSSFRELTMFCCALRIDKIIPTVNVGSAKSREKMKMWCDKWAMQKKRNGLFKVQDGQEAW